MEETSRDAKCSELLQIMKWVIPDVAPKDTEYRWTVRASELLNELYPAADKSTRLLVECLSQCWDSSGIDWDQFNIDFVEGLQPPENILVDAADMAGRMSLDTCIVALQNLGKLERRGR